MNPNANATQPQELLGNLTALAWDGARQEFFRTHPELVEISLVETLCSEVARLVGVNMEKAGQVAATARWLAEELDDDRSRGLSARAAANAYHFSGECSQAQALYEAALAQFSKLGDEREEAITRSSALHNLAYLGEYEKVFEWEHAARAVFERLEDRQRLATLEHNLGNILYRQDRWEEALQHYRFAYEEFLKLARAQDVAICMRNIAVCHISLHNFVEALAVYERCRAYCQEQGLTRLVLEVDYNIAYLYYLRGEYTRAIQLFQAARRQCEAAGDEYHKALCDLDQAEIFLELNMVEEAANLAQAAFTSFYTLNTPYETAKALTNNAIAQSRLGRGLLALEFLQQARDIFVREKNQLWPALIDFYRAVVLYREHRPAEAIRLARGARETFAESALAPRAAMCELLLAELLLQVHEPNGARDICYEALERVSGLDMPALEHQAYLVLGQVEEAAGNRFTALKAYRQSHRWLEKLRSQLEGEDLKIAFLKDKQVVYESLVWLTMQDEEPSQGKEVAFDYIERAKSRSLADLMSFRAYALPPTAPAHCDLADQVRTLREELNWFYRQIDLFQMRGGEHSQEEVKRMRRSARRKEDELLRSLRELQAADRELGSLQSGVMVDLETIRSSLRPEATLVEYFIARGIVFVSVVDRRRLEIVALTTASRARELHRLLQFQLSRTKLGSDHISDLLSLIEEATRSHLRELYAELIEPIRHYFDGDHLIFVPHGFLHYVPFHALWDGEQYLVDQFSISYAPSAGVFHLCTIKDTDCDDRSLVLAVADERAPHILEEARAVVESLPGATLLLGEAASEEALRKHGARCRFVHIATHALFRRDNPMFSAIQLGTNRLSLFDLYNLRLGGELVVLSGCGTGLNAVLGADELVGLTRGLLYAGAQSVLVTLWDVNDASTATFMRRFYHHLAKGSQRAQALRLTMRDIREHYPHPYYWAPFVLVGKPAAP